MYYEGWFWLPYLVTIAVILLSWHVFSKKRGIRSATAVTAGSSASASVSASASASVSASASASASGGEYEVFLSFRGNDTRKGFTDFLYTYLIDVGIRTFRDNNELRVGEEIGPELLKAIRESKISIPIFSSDYASSKWCLLKLVQMVQCRKTLEQKILPIFYDVEPSDVRHQTGSYEKAFREHRKKRIDEKTVQGWKEALREVGELKGWELKKETDGHQGELAKMVVEKVLLELKKNYMVVTENLVGIDHHVEKMMEFLNVDSNDVRIVGIHGMGGIGKTTIAKVIYNQLSECFECCCFLADVRETSQTKGLVNLQIQLICKIRKVNCLNIANVDEGISMIKDMVCRKKVLIVLDDVDEKSQFDKLAGKCDWYGSGSRIIVTTRNKEVLNRLEVDKTYEPPMMEPDHSLQLFSKHAFRRDSPLEDYDTLSREVVSTAAGLPLALEIIGSSLFLERKEVWNDTLKKLKEIPDEKVQEKLRISYEALDYEPKQIFLDIACLFIGEDERNPFYMWADCKFFPTIGINVLVRRSLVKIGDDNKLRMHDQLRDLGREIVRKENFREPGKRSRLWLHEEALDILERQMGTEKVEALCLEPFVLSKMPHYNCFRNEEFGQLPNLRFLRVDCADLAGDFNHRLSSLRWLQWRRCPGNSTPTNFHLKNLVILDLSYSNITDDWEGWSQIKTKKLKVLDLSNCDGLIRTPDFSTFATLERLILSWCDNLVQIDPSIENLTNLIVLDIAHSGITKLPNAIGNLEKLEEIKASCCNLQGEIPSNIGRLSSLRIFSLDSTQICSLPTSICELSCLQTLDLFGCQELQSLPELPPSLTFLRVRSKLMETFPSLPNLINLKELFFDRCCHLLEIPRDIGKLSKLETLAFYETNISSLPIEIGALSRLKRLVIRWCDNLQCIQGLPSSLFKLCLDGCKSVERLPDLSNLKNLSELILVECSKLTEIQGLGKLELLMSLNVSSCGKLAKLDGLEQLESLRYLDTSKWESLERLPNLSNLKKLQKLDTHGCMKLIEIQGLDRLESLEYLNMGGCDSIERLPDLSNLGMLKELNLCECEELVEVEGLWDLESLERLDVSWCISLERLPDLFKLKNLRELKILGCENLTEIRGLEELESLELLDIAGCKLIEKTPDLSNLKKLKELKVGSEKLIEIRGLEELKSLKLLEISGCKLIENLPDLSNLKKLKELKVFRCGKLTEIRGLEKLKSLTLLNISGCKSIENLPDLSNTCIIRDSLDTTRRREHIS